MRRQDVFRSIFAELRTTLGQDVPGGELLKIANLILKAYTSLEDYRVEDRVPPPRNFDSLPVDEAMRDGGWRILEFEESQCSMSENGHDGYTAFRALTGGR